MNRLSPDTAKIQPKTFKCLILFSSFYVTSLLLTAITVHKMLMIGGLVISGGTFIYPFSYFFGDVVTEVYGYKISRQLIWASFACMFIFDIGAALLAKTPPPHNWHNQAAYLAVLGPLPRVFIGDFLALNASAFLNAYIIAKSKIFLSGRYFWIRSLVSTLLGEAVFNLIAFTMMFIGVVSFKVYLEVMLFSYFFKAIWAIIAVLPATILMRLLKRIEGIDIYDYTTNFNPFKLSDT